MHEYCVQLALEQHEYDVFSFHMDCMNIKRSFKTLTGEKHSISRHHGVRDLWLK